MNYTSTRANKISVSAADAVLKGLVDDGGLFVPESLPRLDKADFARLSGLQYALRAAEVFRLFLSGYEGVNFDTLGKNAYDNFDVSDVAEIKRIGAGAYFLELWHGPTAAFKDMALQALPLLLTAAADKLYPGRKTVILTATSGDTGKAALEGFKDVAGTEVIVFYPEDGVSPTQKLQMQSQEGDNLYVVGVKGNFDDCQTTVKTLLNDKHFEAELAEHNLFFSSANSINVGRLIPQIAYYVSAYCDLVRDGEINNGEKVNVCVPTGNFGNILAAYYARKIGVPFGKLLCASNRNKVLTDFIETGVYDKRRDFFVTNSPSMDILISSNLERLIYHLYGNDDKMTYALMNELNDSGRYRVSEDVRGKLQSLIYAGSRNDEETKEHIKHVWEKHHYLIDTHTAVAFGVYKQYKQETGDLTKTIIASTASPYKFADSVYNALTGKDNGTSEDLEQFTGVPIPEPLAALKGKQPRFTRVAEVADLKAIVAEYLGF
ncbi:MAG: threonine synthase [Oscillospiraceae bacterium]|jgi:threonine synthase|nr:threonine synthase [Oscillospiraceae bacterium]